MDEILATLERRRAKAKLKLDALRQNYQEVDAAITRLTIALEEITRAAKSTPEARRRPKLPKPLHKPIPVKDAVYRALQELHTGNRGQGATTQDIREAAGALLGSMLKARAIEASLWTLGTEGKIRRVGIRWFPAATHRRENTP